MQVRIVHSLTCIVQWSQTNTRPWQKIQEKINGINTGALKVSQALCNATVTQRTGDATPFHWALPTFLTFFKKSVQHDIVYGCCIIYGLLGWALCIHTHTWNPQRNVTYNQTRAESKGGEGWGSVLRGSALSPLFELTVLSLCSVLPVINGWASWQRAYHANSLFIKMFFLHSPAVVLVSCIGG